MEKRFLIFVVLSFVVLIGFRFLFPEPVQPPEAPPAATTPANKSTTPTPPAATPSAAPATPEDIHAEGARTEEIDTARYHAIVSNAGGVLRSIRLKEYRDAEGKPIELISPAVGEQVGWPLAIRSGDSEIDKRLVHSNFVMHRDSANQISLEFAAGDVHVQKQLAFDPDRYLITINTTLTKAGKPLPYEIALQGDFGDQSIPYDATKRQAVYNSIGRFQRIALGGIKDPQDITADFAGVEDQYFIAMFLPSQAASMKVSKSDFNQPDGTTSRALFVSMKSDKPVQLYLGPKEEGSLRAADARLGDVPDFGRWFGFISRPLHTALLWTHKLTGNYGWAIVILTLLLNVVLFPFRIKQQVSMQKMQKKAPQIRALQEKYKKLKAGDPRRSEVEAELMEINKEQMAGCLPQLLQMPLLIGIWSMLGVAIEVRRAPWMLWIHDLSQFDPYFILPISMAVAMFVQQKMTPTTADPTQARMMMFMMPLLFLYIFRHAQSGVALYWLTGNIVGIGQQWLVRTYWKDDGVPPSRLRKAPQPG